jgi:outer membrane biosynthesis protein TonB
MKPGMTISCAGHAAALFFGFMAVSARPMEALPVQALPVSFVSEKDFSQLAPKAKNAPQLKVPDVNPLADKADATTKSVDQLAPKVPNNPEVTADADKPFSGSKPEPKPGPKAELKAAPIPPEKPDKAKGEYRPDQIANLLKKDAAKDSPKRDEKPTQPMRDNSPKFDANQRDSQRQVATAQTANDFDTLDAVIGAQDAQLSLSEMEALRARISNCWNPPAGIDPNSTLYVVLRVLFKTDGSLLQAPVLVESSATPLGPALAESAKRALLWCQPFTMLRPEHYDQWKDLDLKFVPAELGVEQSSQ